MSKSDRQRRLARERYERQIRRRAERARARRRNAIIGAVTGVAVVLAGLGTVAFWPEKSKNVRASDKATAKTGDCEYIKEGNAAKQVGTPPAKPDTAVRQATVKTNRGDIVIDLLPDRAPCTVHSLAFLAQQNYFDNSKCHRLTTAGISVLQCGDPSGTGTGGPGYRFANENTQGAKYGKGTVAMAHSQMPDSNGSQFFLVYADSDLPAEYTPFGTVVKGLDIVEKVAAKGVRKGGQSADDGPPKAPLIIKDVTISKG